MTRPGRGKMPRLVERCQQLTEARADNPWLADGSVIVQQQAIRDHDQGMANFFAGTHRRPRWRKAGHDEGFRVTRDRPSRWHIAFAVIPDPVNGPGTGEVLGIDRGVAVSAALSTGEMLRVPGLTGREQDRLRRLQRKLAKAQRGSCRRGKVKAAMAKLKARETDHNVRPKAGLNREIQRSACGHVAAESRESQALFRCVACTFACNADVNAAKNIAAGCAVTARGGLGAARPMNREPQLLLQRA
jgi:putative transposase